MIRPPYDLILSPKVKFTRGLMLKSLIPRPLLPTRKNVVLGEGGFLAVREAVSDRPPIPPPTHIAYRDPIRAIRSQKSVDSF